MSSAKGAFEISARLAGPRQERAERARQRRAFRRRRYRVRALLGLAALLAGATLTAGPALVEHFLAPGQTADAASEPEHEPAQAATDDQQRRLLLVTVDEEGEPATSVTLLAGPDGDAPASALFLPTTALVSVPGFGLDQLASAQRYGGADLVVAAVENALSVRIDEVATVTADGFAEFLGRAGEVRVDLAERVVERDPDGSAHVRFERGEHAFGGDELAELWLQGSSAQDELDAFGYRRQVLERLLDVTADPVVRDRLVADGAPQLRTQAGPEWLRGLFTDLAEAQSDEGVRYNLLPVERFGTAGADGRRAYRIHEGDTARLVTTLFGGQQDMRGSGSVRAQVLNGVGTPGVGQLVDERLADEVRLVLTGNADSFDHVETRVLVYEESPEILAAAERVQEQLGVGTIQVSRQPQSIVDITVVVGADLVQAAEASYDSTDGSESTD